LKDADSGCVRKCFLAAALLLLGLEAGIGLRHLLLGMVNGAGRLGANLPQFALLDAVRHDGLGGVLARFELGPFRLLRRVGLLLANFDVLVARDGLLAFRLLLVCRADLDKFRLSGNLGFNVRVEFCGIAVRVGARIGIPVVAERARDSSSRVLSIPRLDPRSDSAFEVALRAAAHVYGVNTDAVALKVKQEFAAKEKARKAVKPHPKPVLKPKRVA
jgi:hypothetical protein